MEASQIYENILNQIQESSLNFKLELSPFSAVISLKKSFIKDRSGNTLYSSSPKINHLQLVDTENQRLLHQNALLQKKVDSLQNRYIQSVDDCEAVYKTKEVLEDQLAIKSEEKAAIKDVLEVELSDKQAHLDKLKDEKEKYRIELNSLISKHEKTCQDLKIAKSENEILRKSNNSLSVANKSLKKDLHDTVKKKDEEFEKMTCKLKELKEFKAVKDFETREAKKQEKKLAKKRKKEAEIKAVADLKRLNKIKQKESKVNPPNNEKSYNEDAYDTITAESEEANIEILKSDEPNSQTPQLPAHVESSLNPSLETSAIPLLDQKDYITDKFEDFLENFKSDETQFKYRVFVRQMINSDENILDVKISDIKVYNMKLWKSIDSNYRKAFPLFCNGLRNFIKTKLDEDPAAKNYLVKLVM